MKKLISIILLFFLLGITNFSNVFAKAKNKFGVTEVSPYYIVTKNKSSFGTLPSIINPSNLPATEFKDRSSDGKCEKITTNEAKRIEYSIPYGMIGLICDWEDNEGKFLAQALKKAKVANLVGFNGSTMEDSSASRFYLVKHKVKIDASNKGNLQMDGNGDVWYVDTSLSSKSNFIIFDPDLSNKYGNQKTFESTAVFGNNDNNERPLMALNLYVLDGARIDDKMLKKGFYTMEHFLGKKYETNGSYGTLKTTSYDGLNLYDLTYFNEHMIPGDQYYKYCNGDAYELNSNVLAKILLGDYEKEFQNDSTTLSIHDRRTGYKKNGEYICSNGSSGLRENYRPSFISNNYMTDNGSLKFKNGVIEYDSNGVAIYKTNSTVANCGRTPPVCNQSNPTDCYCFSIKYDKSQGTGNADTEFTGFFEPELADGGYGYIQLPKIGVISNKRLIVGLLKNATISNIRDYYEGKTIDIYQLVKVSLANRKPIDSTTNTLKSPLKEKNNYLIDGFDPTDKGWYLLNHHGNNSGTEEYTSLFGGYSIGGTGQGNMYIPLTRGASFYNISTPGLADSGFGDMSKMNERSKSIALTLSQGYIQTETGDNNHGASGNSFGITSYGSIDLGNVLEDSSILVLRNFDADSDLESRSVKYDGNVSSKISLIYRDINPIKTLTSDKSLDGFFGKNSNKNWGITNNTTNCSGTYNFTESDTYSFYGNGENASDISVKECKTSKTRSAPILSGNAPSNGVNVGKDIQQTINGLVNDNAGIKKEVNFIITTLFENINDPNVYNQINTTSNFLENLSSNLDCSISISKALNSDKNIYKTWLDGKENITDNVNYTYQGTNRIFQKDGDNPFGTDDGGKLLEKYHFEKSNLNSSDNNIIKNYYYGNTNTGVSNWLLGDKGLITYECQSLEKEHNLELLIVSDNKAYDYTSNEIGKLSHGNTIITFSDDYLNDGKKLFDYYGLNNGTVYKSGKTKIGPATDDFLIQQDHDTGKDSLKLTLLYDIYKENGVNPVAINTTDAIKKGLKVKGGVGFQVIRLTDNGKYGKVTALLIDTTNGKVVASKSVLLQVQQIQKPLEYTDASKNEQQLVTGYNSSEVGFDGTTYGMNFTITNTKANNAEYPSGGTAGGKNYIFLSSYDKAKTATSIFPMFDKIDTTCSADTEYVCDDGTRTQQDTLKLYELLDSDGTIKIIESKNGTDTEHIAVSGSSPQNGKYVYKRVNGGLIIYLPADKNYYAANTSYTVQLSIPKGKFVGAGLGENVTSSDKDALTIIPTLLYDDGSLHTWDVGTSTLESNNLLNNFYYRWKVTTPSSDACLQELTTGPRAQYLTGNGYHVYLSEEGAKNNGKSCSDSDVKCLLSFEGVATDSNFHNTESSGYSGLNELSDGDMEIGKKYELLVRMIAGGETGANSNGNLKEKDIINGALEMNIDFDYVGNMSIEKGLLSHGISSSKVPLSVIENTGMTNKSFNSLDVYGSKYYYYRSDESKWHNRTVDDTKNNGLKFANTNIPRTKDLSLGSTYPVSSNGNGTSDRDRTSYYGVYAKITGGGQPKANLTVNFGTKNVPTELQNKSCNFSVDFPEIEACQVSGPKVSRFEISTGEVDDYDADNVDDFMTATDSVADDLNSCGSGNGDSDSFSIEREYYKYDSNNDPTGGLVVNFRIENDSSCGTGDFSKDNGTDLTVKVHITDRSRDIRKCVANIGDSMRFSGDDIIIEGVELDAGRYKNVEVQCAFNERDASCSEDNHEVTVEASNTYGSDDDGTGEFKKCMLPTLKIEDDANVDDGNSDNDKEEDVYTTAYPFEFKECGDNIRHDWRIRYEGGCGVTDNGFKDFKLIWESGNNIDDKGTGRDFIQSLSGSSIRGVSPTKSGNTLTWDFNNANLNDILDTTLIARVRINPIKEDQMRLEDSKFRLVINRTDIIKSELDTDTDNRKTGNGRYESRELSSAIGVNPVVSNEKIYDLGLYNNPDEKTVIIHREEINETSKKGTKTGDAHKEPVIYEVKVENPTRNNFYGLNELKFDLNLNDQKGLIDDVDTARPNVGDKIDKGGWEQQSLNAGNNQNYKGYFLLDPTLKSKEDPDYGTVENNLSEGEGTPSLDITGASCEYKEPFNKWKIKVIENPLVINSIKIKDDSPTPDGGNQHLPGDIINFKIELTNNSNTMDFHNTFVELDLDANDTITDTNLNLDNLSKVFEFVGGPAGHTDPYYNVPLYDLNGGTESCGFVPKTATEGPKLICIINEEIKKETTYVANINMLIKVNTDFYNKLKASTVDEKYWYPIIIKEVRYGTPDLDSVTHSTDGNIVYYTSDKDIIPSGDMMGDVIVDDINDPANTVIAAEPDDGKYNFYIGMPYMEIDTRVINSSIGHFSPGDIIEFKTKAWSKSKSYIKNPKIIQKLFKDQVMDFVDVEVLDLSYTADKTNFNTPNKSINVHDLNTDTDPTNDISSRNITDIRLNNDISGTNNILVHSNFMDFYTDGPVAAYYEGVADPSTETGGEVEITSKIKIVKLKKIKRPQIGCGISETIGCVRGVDEGTNPKEDYNEGIIDLDSVGTIEDEKDAEKYEVYFPILKSILFQQQNDSYIPTPGSNMIKGVINDPNTEVVYRVDNFIPSAYDATGTGVGKARKPMSFIRLPVGVRYTEGSAVVIEDLSDNAPYGNEVAIGDPITNTKTEYEDDVDDGTSTYEGDLDDEDPDGDLLPTPEEIIEEENGKCLYGDGEYGFCILQL